MDDIDERRNKMSLIFNNMDYRLVSDGSDWNKLEYVVARKLHVEFRSSEVRKDFSHIFSIAFNCRLLSDIKDGG